MITKEELQKKYPVMLNTKKVLDTGRWPYPLFGIEVSDGWLPLLDNLLGELKEVLTRNGKDNREHFHVQQVKEKFGGLRFYYSVYSDDITAEDFTEISRIVDDYEMISNTTCEICGKEGEIHSYRGWLSCMCESCRKENNV